MTHSRRFGLALFVLALGNATLALGNLVSGGSWPLAAAEGVLAVLLAVVAWSLRYGQSDMDVDPDRDRLMAIATLLVAIVGVLFAGVGFAIAIAA